MHVHNLRSCLSFYFSAIGIGPSTSDRHRIIGTSASDHRMIIGLGYVLMIAKNDLLIIIISSELRTIINTTVTQSSYCSGKLGDTRRRRRRRRRRRASPPPLELPSPAFAVDNSRELATRAQALFRYIYIYIFRQF